MAVATLTEGIISFTMKDVSIAATAIGDSFAIPSKSGPASHARSIGWRAEMSAAPTSLTLLLEGSYDDINWFKLDTLVNISGEARTVSSILVRFVRANLTAIVGGSGKTMTVELII